MFYRQLDKNANGCKSLLNKFLSFIVSSEEERNRQLHRIKRQTDNLKIIGSSPIQGTVLGA